MASHWHAFAWTGHERPPDRERVVPANPVPPLEIAQWLLKPANHLLATYRLPEDADEAFAWLEAELTEYGRGPRDLQPEPQLHYARDCLDRGADVVWGYYSALGRYVSRALIVCPPAGRRCPYKK